MFFSLNISESRKGLIKDILAQYAAVDEPSLKELINVKDSEINVTKLITHGNNDVQVYMVDKIPYFFKYDKNEQMIPTGKFF